MVPSKALLPWRAAAVLGSDMGQRLIAKAVRMTRRLMSAGDGDVWPLVGSDLCQISMVGGGLDRFSSTLGWWRRGYWIDLNKRGDTRVH
jgi:hypothetical protein